MSLLFSARLKLGVTSLLLFLLPAEIAQATSPLFLVEPSVALAGNGSVCCPFYLPAGLATLIVLTRETPWYHVSYLHYPSRCDRLLLQVDAHRGFVTGVRPQRHVA